MFQPGDNNVQTDYCCNWYTSGIVICGTLMISEPNSYSAKILSIGQANQYGDQNAMVFIEDKNIHKAHNIGNTGFYKIGSSITFEDKDHLEQTFGFVLLAVLSFVIGLFLIMFSPLIK